ncbi:MULTISPECIES: RluA family pseudouridine synthase [unclassified Campylobacter]|uniref:RluA family pseudouridine synthase n=1 Tax=unclassified Campylobacter TaxID=2593542 RepID=UPI0012381660|nr:MULTISPECIES: RluA family pseudouridine synthase [unclassified Campylobacter]KAA6224707.1 RluA family pseudouridine synthase [Campylobacter sp. LR185c]KAA6225705.1 RluA family pseudouridine synthase [Campylobacter sp. LR286c]KAA6225825.1 RluA family pseudouridine synthase [Campylobacter sp. LR196d]KAA6229678.1 RluA family pseudouridine synthase [Campylobacter sp. LR291e]KAA6230076.1 RluA family pseudouridine synthase [Campylobacter sp. LR264d]
MQTFLANEEIRLDIFLAQHLKQSRNQVSLLIKNSLVKINNKIQNKTSFKLNLNDEICILKPKIKDIKEKQEINFDLEILYEDDDLLVLNKTPNLVVHGANSVKGPTLVDWLINKNFMLSNLGGQLRPGLIHRLDKDTSGAIVIAKNNFTHKNLSEQLFLKTMGRIYLALIDLPLKDSKIIIEKALIRTPNNRIKKLAIDEKGILKIGAKSAKSAFISCLDCNDFALISAKLFTGRTHQIRAHLASINRHILGDELYGFKGEKQRVMLHSYYVYFTHPRSKKEIFVKAPLMQDFKERLLKKFTLGEVHEKITLDFLLSEFNSFS